MGNPQRRHGRAQLFSLGLAGRMVALGHQAHELLATVARYQVLRALEASLEASGHLLQAGIAGLVAVMVVVAFEMVDINHQ